MLTGAKDAITIKRIAMGRFDGDGDKKPKDALSRVKPLPYGMVVGVLRNLENPHGKGLRNGKYFEYKDGSTAFGLGTDTRTNTTGRKLAKRARKEGIPVQEAHDIAVRELRMHDRAIMKALVDEKVTNRPDTISPGVRMMAAQARYNKGNIIDIFPDWSKAVVRGDANGQKAAILEGTPNTHRDRRNKVSTYNIYGGRWDTEADKKGLVKRKPLIAKKNK